MSMENIHEKVVKYIRKTYPHFLTHGLLRELLKDGQPDLMIFNKSGEYSGFAINFKTIWDLTNEEKEFLIKLEQCHWKILVSNNYHECVEEIDQYSIFTYAVHPIEKFYKKKNG